MSAIAGGSLADGACCGIEMNDDVGLAGVAFVFCVDRNDDKANHTGGMTI